MKPYAPKRKQRGAVRPLVIDVRSEQQERRLPKPKAPSPDSFARFLLHRHQHAS